MPIQNVKFENNILYLDEMGRITAGDAQQYVDIVREHSANSLTAIVVLINATNLLEISPQASLIFANSSSIPNVLRYLVVTNNSHGTQEARVLGRQNLKGTTTIFSSLSDATAYAAILLNGDD
jgi:hypothetical protein